MEIKCTQYTDRLPDSHTRQQTRNQTIKSQKNAHVYSPYYPNKYNLKKLTLSLGFFIMQVKIDRTSV